MKTVRKNLRVIILFLLCPLVASSQTAAPGPDSHKYEAPIEWTRYMVPEMKVSFIFPKLPVVMHGGDSCTSTTGKLYYQYAGDAVYEFAWNAKMPGGKAVNPCSTPIEFSRGVYESRLAELRQQNSPSESELKIGLETAVFFSWKTQSTFVSRALIWHQDRWFELAITSHGVIDPTTDQFFQSIRLNNVEGKDVAGGSDTVLGDTQGNTTSNGSAAIQPDSDMTMLLKPPARYTEAARGANVEGSVLLRVALLANGSVGDVAVLKGLPYGLSEQAIAAVRRSAFLPKRIHGVAVPVARKFEYKFSIF